MTTPNDNMEAANLTTSHGGKGAESSVPQTEKVSLYAHAIWPYDAIEDNELSFGIGDRIEVLDRCNADWYEGRLVTQGADGKPGVGRFVGYFPATRVKLLEVRAKRGHESRSMGADVGQTLQPNQDSVVQPPVVEQSSPAAAVALTDTRSTETSSPPPPAVPPSPAAQSRAASPQRPPPQRSNLRTELHDENIESPFTDAVEVAMPTSPQYEALDAAEVSRDSRPAAPNRNNSTWELVENPEGEHYYWNTDTGETSWTSPESGEGMPLGAQAQPITDSTGNLMMDLTKVLDEFDSTLGEPSVASPYQNSAVEQAKVGVTGTATPMSAVSNSTDTALIPDLPSPGPPPPPPAPPVMKFPSASETGVSAALDSELLALGRIESVPETIIRREAYLLTKKKHHGAGSKKPASSWAQYWAVLCVGFLFLFKDQSTKTSTKKPVHVIRLDSVRVDEVGKDTTKKKGAFRMELDQGAVWLIQPGKEGEMWEWMDAIREASREKSTSAEYENALSTLLPQGIPTVPDRKSNSQAGKSVGNVSTVTSNDRPSTTVGGKSQVEKNRSRRPTGAAKASGEVDDGSYEGKQAKQSVKTKIGAFLFKRPSVDKLKEQGIIKDEDVIFGGSLAAQVERGSGPIPAVVRLCVEQVDKRGLTSQGIYRLSGNASTIQKLKVQFNAQEKVDLGAEDLDINAVASTLKLYFRELDDPLIPFAFYDRFIAAAKLEDYNARLIELKNLVQAIPRPNYDTFEFIIRHLARVMSHSAENKMEPSNLAIVFGPTLIRPPEGDGTSGYTNILNMSYQNLLVEAVLVQVDWMFDGLDH
ncbi:hypothetical protein HDU87_002851 [Geranomyces variabilis]|uniref:RhoGAP-domain-containing protein n=1 Tax=Geranomyces variabilis TaxID=109894 RepID=A0AAD5TL32_9FUNG|nr:hypothetical protein HDU87_002851 [Geranomyces variabilis]